MATQIKKNIRNQSASRLNKRKFRQSPEMEIRIKNGVAVITGYTDDQEAGQQTAQALSALGNINKVFNLVQVEA